MEISLYRHPGYYGRFATLDVLVNDTRVETIAGGETKRINVSGPGALLRVEMQKVVKSQEYRLVAEDDGQLFHCGPKPWVVFDIFNLAYLPVFSKNVFFIRRYAQSGDV